MSRTPAPAPRPPAAFVYECPGHAADVLRQLDEQRRSVAGGDAGLLCDASVAAGGSRFPAHRAVLAACSDFFGASVALLPPGAPGTERRTDVHAFSLPTEVTARGLEQILHFAYTGKLYLDQDSYEDVHRAASLLRIRTLDDACFRFLEHKLGRPDEREPRKAQACGLSKAVQASYDPCFPREKVAGGDGGGNVCGEGRRQTDEREPSKAQACGLAGPTQPSFDPCLPRDKDGFCRGGGVSSGGRTRPGDAPPRISEPFECSEEDEDRDERGPRLPPAFVPRGALPLLRCPLRDMDASCRVIVSTIRTGRGGGGGAGGGDRPGRDRDRAPAAESRSDVEVFEVEPGARLASGPAAARSPRSAGDARHAGAAPGPPLKRGWGPRDFGEFGGGGGAVAWNDGAAGDRQLSLLCPKYRRYQVACSNQDGAAYRGVMSGWWAPGGGGARKGAAAGDRAATAAPRGAEPRREEAAVSRASPAPCRDPAPRRPALAPEFPAWSGEGRAATEATARKRSEALFSARGGDRGCGGGGGGGGAWAGPALASAAMCGRGFVGRLDMKRVESESDESDAEETEEENGGGERGGDGRGGGGIGVGIGSDAGMRAGRGVAERFGDATSSPVNLSTSCRPLARSSAAAASFPASSSCSSASSSSLAASLSPRLPAVAPFASCPVLGPHTEAAAMLLERTLGLRVGPGPAPAPRPPVPRPPSLCPPRSPAATPPAGASSAGGGEGFSSSGDESFSDDSDSCASKPDCPEVSLPFPVAGVPEMSRNEFQALLRRHALSAAQLEMVHDVRRRSKNRMAARRCRKRKLDCINGLEGDIRKLVSERDRALRERELLSLEMAAVRQSCAGLYQTICREVRSSPEHVRLLGPYLPATMDRPVPGVSFSHSAAAVCVPLPMVKSSPERATRSVDSPPVAMGEVVRPGCKRGSCGSDGGDDGGLATVVVEMRAMEWSTASEGGHGVRARPGDGASVAQPDVENDAQEDRGTGNGDGFARLQISAT